MTDNGSTLVDYDPRAQGARCDVCPLGPEGCLRGKEAWRPVRMEHHAGAKALVVLESPDSTAKQHSRPLAGQDGTEWNHALAMVGRHRTHLSSTYTIACKLPGVDAGAQSRFDKALDRINKNRKLKGKDPHPHPRDCCRPRLLAEASAYRDIVAAGKEAVQALTRSALSIQKTRGGPMWVDEDWRHVSEGVRRVFPTMNPGYVAYAPEWRPVLHADLGKAFRWFEGKLRWKDPDILWRPTPDQLEKWLDDTQGVPFDSYDVETDGIIATECGLRTLSIATPDLDAEGRVARPDQGRPIATNSQAVGITFMYTNGAPYYSPEDEARIKDILIRKYFCNPSRLKVGHNAGFFDRLVIEHHFGVTPAPLWDTLFPTRFRAPDLPKSLKVVGSVLTDVERWENSEKGESHAVGSAGDDALLHYNCIDSTVNARIVTPLVDAAAAVGAFNPLPEELRPPGWENRRWDLWTVDHAAQDMCCEMHKAGIWIDQKKRLELEVHFEREAAGLLKNIQKLAGTDFNPNSGPQVRDLFYKDWKLECPPRMEARDFYTETGHPGTGDAVIRGHLSSGLLNEGQKELMMQLRLYRRVRTKILGTVLYPMRLRAHDPKKGLVFEDGRVRSTWNAHTTAVGRLSSSNPNCYDAETEVLTPRGWVRFPELRESDTVAQWDNGAVSFVAPTGRIRGDADRFVSLQSNSMNLQVTANHRCLVETRRGRRRYDVPAGEFPSDRRQYHAGKHYGGRLSGTGLSGWFVKLVIATQADGAYRDNGAIRFGLKKPRKIDRMKLILRSLCADFTMYDCAKGVTEFYLKSSALTDRVRAALSESKCFDPAWVTNLDPDALAVFGDEVFFWDGCWTRKNHYASKHKVNADCVQTALVLNGQRANVRRYVSPAGSVSWQVDRVARDYSLTTNVEKSEVAGGEFFCVSVPSSYLLVRRGGKVVVSGNCQNIGNRKGQGPLKGIFSAPPGRIFIGADLDQAHLKIVANYWKIPVLMEAFLEGKDPHNTLAYAIFGAKFKHASGWGPDGFSLYRKPVSGDALAMRNVMKTFRYASIYWASPDTVWQVLTATENDDGTLPYLFMEPRQVRVFQDRWLKAEPEWYTAWQDMLRLYDAQGYMESVIFKRRSGGLSDGKKNEIVNNPVLSTESDAMRIAEQRIIHRYPYTGDGRGLIHQCHDSVGLEIDLPPGLDPLWRPTKGEPLPREIEEAKRYVEWAMTVHVPGWEIPITAEADVGRTLKDV